MTPTFILHRSDASALGVCCARNPRPAPSGKQNQLIRSSDTRASPAWQERRRHSVPVSDQAHPSYPLAGRPCRCQYLKLRDSHAGTRSSRDLTGVETRWHLTKPIFLMLFRLVGDSALKSYFRGWTLCFISRPPPRVPIGRAHGPWCARRVGLHGLQPRAHA